MIDNGFSTFIFESASENSRLGIMAVQLVSFFTLAVRYFAFLFSYRRPLFV